MAIQKIANLNELLELLSSTEPDKLVIVFFTAVDIDEVRDIAMDLGIPSTPTFHFYKAADKIDGFSGADEAKLTALTEKYLHTAL
ncbi:hypothetical protein BGZ68_002797 [Mortierella alpina]|nr:hypothetical protein BGZ68_002797 [Mortierella alpina]